MRTAPAKRKNENATENATNAETITQIQKDRDLVKEKRRNFCFSAENKQV